MGIDTDLTADEMLHRAHNSQEIIKRERLGRGEIVYRIIDYLKENPEGDLVVNIPHKIGLKQEEVLSVLWMFYNPRDVGIDMNPLVNSGYDSFFDKEGSPFYVKRIGLAKDIGAEGLDKFFEEYKTQFPN